MLDFNFLWVFLLLPIPLIVRHFLAAKKRNYAQLWIPLAEGLQTQDNHRSNPLMHFFLPWLLWLLLLTSLAQPVWLGEPIRIQQQSRDMMLSLDLSGSMDEIDMPLNGKTVNRLTLVKSIVKEFISKREGDRVGLILFADHAYLQTPLTFDLNTVETMVDETEIGLVGQRTAIGESIAMAIKRFVENENEQRVLILLTDGANTSGKIQPITAAKQAAKNNITIYTIGIGADEMYKKGFWGKTKVNPSADLDEGMLKEIAQVTDGQYFRARNQDDLERIYNTINQLQPIDSDVFEFRPEKNLFFWPLSFALVLLIAVIVSLRLRGEDEL